MKDIKQIIAECLKKDSQTCVSEAVHELLGESLTVGQTVAVMDDPIYGFTGAKGRVKSISETNSGFVEVELENGTILRLLSSLLVPV